MHSSKSKIQKCWRKFPPPIYLQRRKKLHVSCNKIVGRFAFAYFPGPEPKCVRWGVAGKKKRKEDVVFLLLLRSSQTLFKHRGLGLRLRFLVDAIAYQTDTGQLGFYVLVSPWYYIYFLVSAKTLLSPPMPSSLFEFRPGQPFSCPPSPPPPSMEGGKLSFQSPVRTLFLHIRPPSSFFTLEI